MPDKLPAKLRSADLFTAEPAAMLCDLFEGVMRAADQSAQMNATDPRAVSKLEALAEQLEGCRQMALRARQRLLGTGG